ncbi:MAG: hypothetical protein QXI06_03800, partial [Sulfolobales archaeon]
IFVYGFDLPQALDAPRFVFTEPIGRKKVVVENFANLPNSISLIVERVKRYGPTGLVHVALVDSSKRLVQVVSDPRSEGVALAI